MSFKDTLYLLLIVLSLGVLSGCSSIRDAYLSYKINQMMQYDMQDLMKEYVERDSNAN